MNTRKGKFIYKKKIIAFIILGLVLLLTGCASHSSGGMQGGSGVIEGLQFEYIGNISHEDDTYQLFIPKNVNHLDDEIPERYQALQYVYQEINYPNVDNWRINYYYQYDFLVSNLNIEDEALIKAYEIIKTYFGPVEESLGISFDEYDFNNPTHIELISKDPKALSTYLTVLYFPCNIKSIKTNQTYLIHIPVKTFFAYRYDNTVVFDYLTKEVSISYNRFISLSNISDITERGNKYV